MAVHPGTINKIYKGWIEKWKEKKKGKKKEKSVIKYLKIDYHWY